jgi:hypothetical protein
MNRRQFATGTASALLATRAAAAALGRQSTTADPIPGQLAAFTLRDYPNICDFPEQLLSYPIELPHEGVPHSDLRLYQQGKHTFLPFQLSEIKGDSSSVRSARLHFRSDLKRGENKTFVLLRKPDAEAAQVSEIEIEGAGKNSSAIRANQLQVMVPSPGRQILRVPISQAPAPLLALSRKPGEWVGQGHLDGPTEFLVEEMEASILERGPLFVSYAVRYSFGGQRSYRVVLRVLQDESHVEVDEFLEGIGPADNLAFRFSYKDGVDPDGRLLMQNGGYSNGGPQQCASGRYDQGVNGRGLLPAKLGIYTPNSINLPRSIAFWKDSGENAILFALRRLPDWKTSRRALWSASDLPDNLEFYATASDKYMRAALVGPQRHWAVALIPRNDVIVRGVSWGESGAEPRRPDHVWRADSSMEGLLPYGAGPEIRLLQKLNDFSLDRYKTYIFDFPEDIRTARFQLPHTDIHPEDMTATEFSRTYKREYTFLAQVGWDVSGEMGANHWGWSTHPQSINYAHNFLRWSPEERLEARSWLVMAAYLMELDTAMPQWSMLGGHPNFAAEYKQVLGIAAGLFPHHPHAARWRDTYLQFWTQYLDLYVRKGDPANRAVAGRFTESIACYNYASLEAVCMAASGFQQFDGTQILDRPDFHAWANWELSSRLPFRVSGARVVPPQGAHAAVALLSPGGRWYNAAYAVARLLRDTAPGLADQWLWMITDGAEGKKPDALASAVYEDYGPVMRHDFGGADEAFVHLQQLNNRGYRWSPASNGVVYFAAKGKVWSWNQVETNGDELDISKLSLLQVGKQSLGPSTTTSVLYDFGFAQFYRAEASKSPAPYQSRAAMLVRGDYLALADRLIEGQAGDFHWVNETNGLTFDFYRDAQFNVPLRTMINDNRFPLNFMEADAAQLGLPAGTFAIRGKGHFVVPVAGTYQFRTNWNTPNHDVPSSDSVRLVLDGHAVLSGKGPQNGHIELVARQYTLLFEYISAGISPPFVQLSCQQPDEQRFQQLEKAVFRTYGSLPTIHASQGNGAQQLHLVSPLPVAIDEPTAGTFHIGEKEFVMFADHDASAVGDLSFKGEAGYAGPDGLALFEGDHLSWRGLGLTRVEGDFGASLERHADDSMSGRIVGRSYGKLRVDAGDSWRNQALRVTVDGKETAFKREEEAVLFEFPLTQSDGFKEYRITRL